MATVPVLVSLVQTVSPAVRTEGPASKSSQKVSAGLEQAPLGLGDGDGDGLGEEVGVDVGVAV